MFAMEDRGSLVCHERLGASNVNAKGCVFSLKYEAKAAHQNIRVWPEQVVPSSPSLHLFRLPSFTLSFALSLSMSTPLTGGVPALIAIKDQTFMKPSGAHAHKYQLSPILPRSKNCSPSAFSSPASPHWEFMNLCPAIPNQHSRSTSLICQSDTMSRCR